MSYRIVWSNFAEFQLDKIFNFYAERVSIELARNIVFQIKDEVKRLEINPFLGEREELLMEFSKDYRYLIVGHYKLIYNVDEVGALIRLLDVFDTRQNPIKLKRN